MKIGIIGCGNISETYFNSQNLYNNFKVIACADINREASRASAKKFRIQSQSVEEILANKDIDLIVNLTIPSAHKEIILKTLNSNKHSFSEKPLAMSFKDGLEIKNLANDKDLYVGCAPDTFLGAAGQKAKELIENNSIGSPKLGSFNIMSHGMEDWHPNPDFFFKPGAGPVFDLGVYYITQLVNLLGPVKNIISTSATVEKNRTITSKPRYGEKIVVETPTTLIGILEFTNNTKIQYFCSWDVWKHMHTSIEIYGSEGSLVLPDPNFFGGNLLISNKDSKWQTINTESMLLGIPNINDNGVMRANYRGIGLSDMILSIDNKENSRCSIDLSLHVLEIMEGILAAAKTQKIYSLQSSCNQSKILTEKEISKLKFS